VAEDRRREAHAQLARVAGRWGRVPERIHVDPEDRDSLPSRLRTLARLRGLSVEGGSLEGKRVIAIVGTRGASSEMLAGARWLAARSVEAGLVVASGGAFGIDAAAHEGAMAAGGETWAVLGHGCDHVYPRGHASLYERIVAQNGRLIWPFPPGQRPAPDYTFQFRNGVLVALADAIVVVQAPVQSGARDTAKHARRARKPLWVVPPVPWVESPGAREELRLGARPLYDFRDVLAGLREAAELDRTVGVGTTRPLFEDAEPEGDPAANAILRSLGDAAKHPDELVRETGLSFAVVSRALLTLSLDTVVVVAPDGRYRRCH
jgi:DNA processing protein